VGSAALGFARRENTVKNQKESTVKKMRRLYRIGALVGAILLPIGVVLATGIPEASASTIIGHEYCIGNDCLNAWNGGPWVNVYTGGPHGTPNNYFTDICDSNTNICEIVDTGGNAWAGKCIGDAYNESGQADTSLDGCTGWGTSFKEITCSLFSVAFYNVHWGGYLGPPSGAVNGSHWYLNKSGKYCFGVSN
jgi:hypothetical protein